MANPILDQERVAFLSNRSESGKMQLSAWPRQQKELPVVEVDVDWVCFSVLNHRTKAEQLRAIHRSKQPDLFSANPLGKMAQKAQYDLLCAQDGFRHLKDDLKERGQQEPAVLTADGILINGNRRSAALRSLYHDDGHLGAKYVRCLVLPGDATPDELMDLEAELQVAKDFKEEYSWINAALLIEELYEREKRDFERVAIRMHRPVAEVKVMFDKLQQVHQLVALSAGTRLHIDFKENESAFDELAKHIRNKPNEEAEPVRAAYFLGTLTGVNYRKLRHLRRADAAELVMREIQKDKTLQPVISALTAADVDDSDDDILGDVLGKASDATDLTLLLSALATKERNASINIDGGDSVSIQQVYDTLQGAITAAADEAGEEAKDQSAVMAPINRTEAAINELKRAILALPKARALEGWSESKFKGKIEEVSSYLSQLSKS